MNKHIAKKLIYLPIQKIIGHDLKNHTDELFSLQHLKAEEVQNYKLNKINQLLEFSQKNIRYYNLKISDLELLKNNVRKDNLYQNMPFITKNVIRKNMDDFMCRDIRMNKRSTSGTTGEPFVFYKDVISTSYMDAMMNIAYSWHGIEIGDRQARIWGSRLKTLDKVTQNIKDSLLNRKRLSAFRMKDEICLQYYKHLLDFRPKYIYAYANGLYQFGNILRKNNINPEELGIQVAICTGEVLFDYQREKIQKDFNCKVINEYGTTENGIIGFECEYGKMHVLPTVFVEILNPDEKGTGEIAITELNSRSIPFIKYKTGDRGKLKNIDCECGRPFEVIELYEGRVDSYIVCPNGDFVYDAVLAYCLKDYVHKFRAYQELINEIKIQVVPKVTFNNDIVDSLIKLLKEYLSEDMKIIIEKVDEIPATKTGKFNYFESKITPK